MNYIVSLNIGSEKYHNKSVRDDNSRYVKGSLVSSASLLIYRSSSAVFKLLVLVSIQRDDMTSRDCLVCSLSFR